MPVLIKETTIPNSLHSTFFTSKGTKMDSMMKTKLRDDFTKLTKDYFYPPDVYDWSRFDFSESSVLTLRECVKKVRRFSTEFTRMDNADFNCETIELMDAIEFEIRRRPLDEQYPEMWNPLKAANEALSRIAVVQETQNDRRKKITWNPRLQILL